MADLTPYVNLTEKVIDNPSAVQVDNSFIVGGVVIVEETDVTEPTLVRSQKELLQHFNGGRNLSKDDNITLKNAYRLVKKCALRLMPAGSPSIYYMISNNSSRVGKKYKNLNWTSDDYIAFEITESSDLSLKVNFDSYYGREFTVSIVDGINILKELSGTFDPFNPVDPIDQTSSVLTEDALEDYNIVIHFNPNFRGYSDPFSPNFMNSMSFTTEGLNPTEAFDKLHRNELLTYTMYSDLGYSMLTSYIPSCTQALHSSDGVLLRTPVFASLSGPNQAELPSSSTKTADGDQCIYHFPWGVDSTTASFEIDVCPSVMYIEAVVTARNAGHPYAGIYAHRFGVVSGAPELKVNLGREDRDKLLSLGYNTIFKDERPRYNHTLIVSNRTSTTLNNPMNKESHRRLANKINTDAFTIAEDFIGRVISDLLYEEVTSTFKSYIEGQILVYPESLESYKVICDRTNNDDMDRANNRINIDIQGQFSGEVDYVNILSTYFSVQPADGES